MITKDEALNTIAVKHGHKDWELARYRLGERHLHVLILEAMDLYASQSNSHKHGVVQAEGSGGYKEHGHGYSAKDKLDTTNPPRQSAVGAAVGNGAAGQSGSGGCRHRWWELADGKVLCDKCGVVKD